MAARAGSHTPKLKEVSRGHIGRAGAKAANLGELIGAGFPVPDGFVVTTDAFDAFLATNSLAADTTQAEVAVAPVPKDVAEAVVSAAAQLGDGPLAVRSSGVAEDLPGASFAGQYETVLDVRGGDALLNAVRQCWASAFSERVLSYRRSQGQSAASMAVLVQRLVAADAAGVAFSANPVTGERGEVMVSAVKGLGERLVSGQASPDEWLVRDGEAVCQRGPEGAIDAGQALAVAELARRVESHFQVPQDIEWALADGQLYLLQARPITALPQPPELPIPTKGYWIKDDAHFTSPITPFGASVYLPALDHGLRAMCEEFGLPIEGVEQVSIGGEAYVHVIPPGGKDPSGPTPPSWLLSLAMRLMPAMRRRRRIAEEAIRTQLPDRTIERWHKEWRDQFRQRAREFLGIDLTELDDEALLRHLDRTIEFLRWGQAVHFRLMFPYLLQNYELATICEGLLAWDTAQTMSLVSGTSEMSSEPGRRLAELAAAASQSSAAREIVTEGGSDVLARLREAEAEIADAFDAYLNEYGHRTTNYEPGSPTLAERPELLVGLLRDRMIGATLSGAHDPGEVRDDAVKRARAALTGRSAGDRERFESALEAAQRVNPVREDNVFFTDNVPNAVLRYTALEIGRRLADRGIIADCMDAVYLEETELRSALRGGQDDYDALVGLRRAEQAWVAAHPGPASYGKDPGQPPIGVMPEPWRTMTKAQLWFMGAGFTVAPRTSADNEITGVPGSPGRYTGTVRIVRDESEFSRLTPGDVLVCPITTPAWSVLFTQAGAVVTNGGGVLAHAAIIARENGIPAVLGTMDGTRQLRDGQTVTVDGSAGKVEVAPTN